MTNNPKKKIIGLEGYGLKVNDIVKLSSEITPYNQRYLDTKKKKCTTFYKEQTCIIQEF